METKKATNIKWHHHLISTEDREKLLGQRGATIWLTGLSGSGKSTVAQAVEAELHAQGRLTYLLDGDNVRHGLNSNLGFSPEDREENIRRLGELAKLFTDTGVIVLTAFISPYLEDRHRARKIASEGRFIEVHVDCPLEVCEERDPKQLYKKARRGEIPEFTGISAPYEAPENPEVYLNTGEQSVEACVETILSHLGEQGIISRRKRDETTRVERRRSAGSDRAYEPAPPA